MRCRPMHPVQPMTKDKNYRTKVKGYKNASSSVNSCHWQHVNMPQWIESGCTVYKLPIALEMHPVFNIDHVLRCAHATDCV